MLATSVAAAKDHGLILTPKLEVAKTVAWKWQQLDHDKYKIFFVNKHTKDCWVVWHLFTVFPH